jgi:hypothetical protein
LPVAESLKLFKLAALEAPTPMRERPLRLMQIKDGPALVLARVSDVDELEVAA